MTSGEGSLAQLRGGGKRALARALAEIESDPDDEATLELLDAAWREPRAQVIGLTGPPGVGKSTLVSALIEAWRRDGRTVGVIAIDPSSRRSGGALLGDRIRLELDPEDAGVFARSMAARQRLGGLAPLAHAAAVLMRALFDVVVVETVGVGQSETDVSDVADTVVLCVQPGSGDSVQYMKAGIAEIPDIAVVNKADLGAVAIRAKNDLRTALALAPAGEWTVPVVVASAAEGRGIDELRGRIAEHAAYLARTGELAARRRARAQRWLEDGLRDEFGRHGLERARRLPGGLELASGRSPFRHLQEISSRLRALQEGWVSGALAPDRMA